MTLALTRCQLALLLGSQRWLPPVLLYAILLGAGWFGGQQLGDSLGWCAAMLVPVCGWITRAATGMEPRPPVPCSPPWPARARSNWPAWRSPWASVRCWVRRASRSRRR
ncbi:hypothetical protein ACFQZC_23730 [Streptacidiphilus monticola]